MRLRACALAAVALAATPAVAAAHVELSPDRVAPGSFTLFTVLSPDESRSPLRALELSLPAGVEVDAVADTPGFTSRAVTDQTHRVTAIQWTGGDVPPGHLALFRFTASVGDAAGIRHLTGVQTFADGTTRVWRTPQVEVAEPHSGGEGDGLAQGLSGAALVVALGAAGLTWRRR
jgi:uncharacterized protein YcnI